MEQEKLQYLLNQYIAGGLTENEYSELCQQLASPGNKALEKILLEYIEKGAQNPEWSDEEQSLAMFRQIVGTDSPGKSEVEKKKQRTLHRIPVGRNWLAAASVIMLLGLGVYLYIAGQYASMEKEQAKKQPVIAPGKEGAILTLADGRQVVLDSLGSGVVAYQNGVSVVLENGQLAYEINGSNDTETVYNTMTTPRGRYFMLVLHDGTKVWLNAASSLRYPAAFNGSERRVSISGEAYFEVAKDAARPFRIMVNGKAEVEVIGTHFNINAYDDEGDMKTTLLEGAVRLSPVARPKAAVVLKPGQQVQLSGAQINVVDDVDLDRVVAWKDGLFNFEDLPLAEVMKQLERWYDIDVVYEGNVPDVEFYGELSRTNTLAGILEALKDAEIRFRMEGRKLVIVK
jgi:transmembrane sensor